MVSLSPLTQRSARGVGCAGVSLWQSHSHQQWHFHGVLSVLVLCKLPVLQGRLPWAICFQLLPLCLVGFFSLWHASHLHWWKGPLTHINGEKKMVIGCDFSNSFNKNGPVGSLDFSQHYTLYGWSVMKLILAWYLWLVLSGPCLSRGRTWGLLYICNTVKLQSRYNGFSFALSQKNQAYCCKCRMVSCLGERRSFHLGLNVGSFWQLKLKVVCQYLISSDCSTLRKRLYSSKCLWQWTIPTELS